MYVSVHMGTTYLGRTKKKKKKEEKDLGEDKLEIKHFFFSFSLLSVRKPCSTKQFKGLIEEDICQIIHRKRDQILLSSLQLNTLCDCA